MELRKSSHIKCVAMSEIPGYSSLESSNKSAEQVLYEYKTWSNTVLITNQRIILGRENWPIGEIENAQLVSQSMLSRVIPSLHTLPEFWLTVSLAIVAGLLINIGSTLRSTPPWFIIITVLTLVLFLISLVYTVVSNPITIYKMHITLRSGQEQTSHQYWYAEDRASADATIQAIQQAISTFSSNS